ncbi:phosphopantetheine-binding protein [Saccharibacillus sacchari]|uniref:Phosphopantetheine-binding protein n=1 Tax=Saccharibacillus sacchari TaxID=456493 RepID=A0ACC6PJC1_9BACL
MEYQTIFLILVQKIKEILPEVQLEDITPDVSLRDVGANSIDRMDILVSSMQQLNVKVPMVNFAKAQTLHELVLIFQESARS